MIPRATMRLQFHAQFTFADAQALVPYLAKLGISHIYASPIMLARPDSMHGYDAVDPTSVSPALGGEGGLMALTSELRRHDMGIVLDIVPNHLGVGGDDNAWWNDVLEYGRESPYADFFDINWDAPHCRGKVLLPILAKPFGDEFHAGSLRLDADRDKKRLLIAYGERRLPLAHASYASALDRTDVPTGRGELASWFGAVDCDALNAAVQRHEPATTEGRERLLALLDRQYYRLAWWRLAGDEINWRRFFELNELAGLRMEHAPAFEATHATIFQLYSDGIIDGVRIDHIDGLAYPRSYGRKLRRRLCSLLAQRPAHLRSRPWIIAEKILAPDEIMPTDWQMDGTSGYDFMTEVNGLMHDRNGAQPLSSIWQMFSGRTADFDQEQQAARRDVATAGFHGHWQSLTDDLYALAQTVIDTRDFSRHAVSEALLRIIQSMQVYRIYAGSGGMSISDAQHFHSAIVRAKAGAADWLAAVIDTVAGWLSESPRFARGKQRRIRQSAMRKFQHLTAPVAAKAVEDTVFYRYGRLISLNEVGGDPGIFGLSANDFHARMTKRAECSPLSMLSTATHDHKRGEDTRARISVLSEIPDEWERMVNTMQDATGLDHRPDLNHGHIYMLWQTIVGAWPPDLKPDDQTGMERFLQRLLAWQEKAMREAKLVTSWAEPRDSVETLHAQFLRALLAQGSASRACLFEFSRRIQPLGAIKSLSQCVLRLTCPGIPDLYQGTDFWDFSLVDPDNRSAVDFATRVHSIGNDITINALMPHWQDGRIKQAVIMRLLGQRRRAPALFTAGEYIPLLMGGMLSDAYLGFIRRHEDATLIVLVPRLAASLRPDPTTLSVSPAMWRGLSIDWPEWVRNRQWRDLLHGAVAQPDDALSTDGLRLPMLVMAADA